MAPRLRVCLTAAAIAWAWVCEGRAQQTSSPTPTATEAPASPIRTDGEGPTFIIERILVEGVRRGMQGIIAAETLLESGESYDERALEEARRRVERLPFVVTAEIALRRGTARGRYDLVITARDVTPLFFGLAIDHFKQAGCCGRAGWTSDGRGPGLGARLFFGRKNEIAGGLAGFGWSSLEGGFATYRVGYTHHDLLGSGAAASLSVDSVLHGQTFGARLALPLDRSNAIVVSAARTARRLRSYDLSWYGGSFDFSGTRLARLHTRSVGLDWQHDSTDDPFVPRGGTRLRAGLSFADSDYADPTPQLPPDSVSLLVPYGSATSIEGPGSADERAWAGTLQAGHAWALARHLSFALEGEVEATLASVDGTVTLDGVNRTLAPDEKALRASAAALLRGTFHEHSRNQYWWTLAGTFSSWGRWRECATTAICDAVPRLAASVSGDTSFGDYGNSEAYGRQDVRATHATVSLSASVRGRWGAFSLGLHYRHYFTDERGASQP